jgi:hypothetical protein
MEREEDLYPIFYNGKYWNEDEVDGVFSAFYHSRFSLGEDSSVYIGDGDRVTPDGRWI